MKIVKIAGVSLLVVILIFSGVFYKAYVTPTDGVHSYPAGFTPIQDDALASRFAPLFISADTKNPIIALYYRAAKADNGSIFIAYHPVWAYEKNEQGKGFAPFMSRNLYTGGLRLQRIMFGKGDVEVVTIQLNASIVPVSVQYEIPEAYDVNSFSVHHVTKESAIPAGTEKLVFKVISWNHLFELSDGDSSNGEAGIQSPSVQYFSDDEWSAYTMVKERQTKFQKNRAHQNWELLSVMQFNKK